MAESDGFSGPCIVELMGHRKLAGFVSEQVVAGQGFLRIDVPTVDGAATAATQLYSPSAVYSITPVTEAVMRTVARQYQPEPVTRWELPQLTAAPVHRCRVCGTTDEGRGWVEDDLCELCADEADR